MSTIVVALSSQRCESSQAEPSRAEPSRAEPSRVNPNIESLPKRRNTIGLPEQHDTFVQSETAMYPCLSQTRGQSVKTESTWLNDTANHRSRSSTKRYATTRPALSASHRHLRRVARLLLLCSKVMSGIILVELGHAWSFLLRQAYWPVGTTEPRAFQLRGDCTVSRPLHKQPANICSSRPSRTMNRMTRSYRVQSEQRTRLPLSLPDNWSSRASISSFHNGTTPLSCLSQTSLPATTSKPSVHFFQKATSSHSIYKPTRTPSMF